MNKLLCIPVILLTHALCFAADKPAIVMCGKDTVVEFDGTRSPDNRFALGWTIHTIAKDAKPVDWAKFEKEGVEAFDDDFVRSFDAPTIYEFIDGLIDLRNKLYDEIGGHLLISLKNGKPLRATSDSPNDRPFVGKLGAADKELNEVYGKLRKQLNGDNLKKLQSDQIEWIQNRNSGAYYEGNEAARLIEDKAGPYDEKVILGAFRKARNVEALKLTCERTEVLQKQLAAARTNNF